MERQRSEPLAGHTNASDSDKANRLDKSKGCKRIIATFHGASEPVCLFNVYLRGEGEDEGGEQSREYGR